MSNDGLIVENMAQSHIHLAVQGLLEEKFYILFLPKSEGKIAPLPLPVPTALSLLWRRRHAVKVEKWKEWESIDVFEV